MTDVGAARTRGSSARTAAAVLVGALAASVVGAQTVEVPTFVVGGPTFGEHVGEVEVAPAPDGSFLVLWGDYDQGGGIDSKDHATVRLMSASGTALGPPSKADTTGHVFAPTVSADGLGGFVAAWQWIGNGEYLFFGQYLGAQGAPTGPDFEVTLHLAGYPIRGGTVTGSPHGPVFLWDENGFWARGLDAAKSRRGGDVRVGAGAYKSDVAPLPDGGFVTTWVGDFGEAPSMGRIFAPHGAPRGPGFAVSELFGVPRVAASPRGDVASVGVRSSPDGTAYEVWARRFDASGTPLGDEFWVHTGASGAYVSPDVEFDDRGNLYVVFAEWGAGAPPSARAWDATGATLGPAVPIGTGTAAAVRAGRLANGAIVNVWNGGGQAKGSIVRLCAAGASVCGDGVRTPACEECDAGAANGPTPGGCRADCRVARCGDGVADPGEACDDGNAAACDGCSATCAVEPGVVCGDGVRSQVCGEQCDAGAANGPLPDGCRADCTLPRCGDGVLDTGEACDDGGTAACDGCDADCRVEATTPEVCAPQPIAGVTAAELARFHHGRDEFLETENAATGLGPVFNGARCAECHALPTVGGASDRSVTRIGAGSGATFDELVASGGPLLQTNGIATGMCSVAGEVVPAGATVVAGRSTPVLFGAGLIEAIPDLSIRLLQAKQRLPLSGRFNVNRATNRIGRFGWKAQVATIHDFAAEAYRDEMGITSPFFPDEPAPQGVPTACDDAPDYEDDGTDVAAFADFMTLLAPLPPPPPTLEARRGRRYFRRAKCHKCHTDKYRTARNFPSVALRNKKVPLFSDLLLHDMGPGLADGIVQESASGSEFRTPPLWGLRFSAPYLHDGRAATLPEAVAAHGGEAQAAADVFLTYTPEQVALLVAYLNSL